MKNIYVGTRFCSKGLLIDEIIRSCPSRLSFFGFPKQCYTNTEYKTIYNIQNFGFSFHSIQRYAINIDLNFLLSAVVRKETLSVRLIFTSVLP